MTGPASRRPRRWAAWPQAFQWLAGGLAAAILALAMAWVLFVPAADWLAHHDVGPAKGPLLQTARDDARGRLLTLSAGLLAAGALIYTARNFTLSRRQLELAQQAMRLTETGQQRTLELTEQGQVTDRYTKAVEQLGSEKLDVRNGGNYGLERIARDSARDYPTVMEVLSAFVREHSREPWPPPDPDGAEKHRRSTRPDVQAALAVIGRRNTNLDIRPIDLTGANLIGANLKRADLTGVDLDRADLRYADLASASLTRTRLVGADLCSANLTYAKLADAVFLDWERRMAINHIFAHDWDRVFAKLAHAQLSDATWPEHAEVPVGWKLNAGSGRLEQWTDDPRLPRFPFSG